MGLSKDSDSFMPNDTLSNSKKPLNLTTSDWIHKTYSSQGMSTPHNHPSKPYSFTKDLLKDTMTQQS